MCGTDANFPMQLWFRILRQEEHQLNLLQRSKVDPTKSVFKVLYGKYDYTANPFAPLGCAIEIHVMPNKRKTWEEHTITGLYVGNLCDHYRCHKILIKDPRRLRVGHMVFFLHKYLTQPILTLMDALLQATHDICDILNSRHPIKGDARKRVDMLLEIFKEHGGVPTKKTNNVKNGQSRKS